MDQLEKIKKFLSEMRDLLEKGATEDLDAKIRAKMHEEMDRRGWTGKQIADHYRDTDESIPAKQRANMKTSIANQNKPKLRVVKEEGYSYNEHGQWKIEKSNYGPKGWGMYSQTDNIKRKATRTGEEHEHIGQNKGVRQYTTSGSSTNAAREAAEAKRQAEANKKAPVRTLADMSDEEKKALEERYRSNVKRASEDGGLRKGADVAKEALTTGHLPVLAGSHQQPTDQEMFGHLVRSEQEIEAMEKAWEQRFEKGFDKLKAPIDHLNKSPVAEKEWVAGKSFNSMLTEEERAERNMHIGKEND